MEPSEDINKMRAAGAHPPAWADARINACRPHRQVSQVDCMLLRYAL
jgi:hypothetical protein